MAAAADFQPPSVKNREGNVEEERGPVGHPAKPNEKNTKRTPFRRSRIDNS
jgi:hypothetical protein